MNHMKRTTTTLLRCGMAFLLGVVLAAPSAAQTLSTGSASTKDELNKECRQFLPPQCEAVPFDTTNDLAFQGNGFALPAVAKDRIGCCAGIHQEEFANDGFYGNGSSWIGGSVPSWLKIDLGRTAQIDTITFGRDRNTGFFDDRDPGQFTIEVALSDNVYANGNDSNDANEYAVVFDSQTDAPTFNGQIFRDQTLQVTFNTPVAGRFVKLTVTNPTVNFEAAIDEVEVFGTAQVAINVNIDIKPGSDPNSINLCSRGATPVAILSSNTFDATDIDSETLTMADAKVKMAGRSDRSLCNAEDVNDDGLDDLVCQFLTFELTDMLDGSSVEATVHGETFGGAEFEGTDSVNIVKDCS